MPSPPCARLSAILTLAVGVNLSAFLTLAVGGSSLTFYTRNRGSESTSNFVRQSQQNRRENRQDRAGDLGRFDSETQALVASPVGGSRRTCLHFFSADGQLCEGRGFAVHSVMSP